MPDIEIVIVKRPHSWIVKRGEAERQCKTCSKFARQVANAVCFEEEVEREVGPADA